MSEILIRWAVAFALVALTFNPTPYNYIHWAIGGGTARLSLAVLVGLLLLAVWIVFLRATLRSIGPFGMVLVAAIFAALVWFLRDLGVLSLEKRAFTGWIGIAGLSLVLGVGLGWSHIRHRLSGQADVDEIDDQ